MFQFPSSGIVHPKSREKARSPRSRSKFQFPSSGIVHPKNSDGGQPKRAVIVSIPFKRDRPSKGRKSTNMNEKGLSFNSLQAGSSIQRNLNFVVEGVTEKGFNSLQAGSSIQSCDARGFGYFCRPCFNSLQAGSSIQSINKEVTISMEWGQFQFPSSGIVHPKEVKAKSRKYGRATFQFPSSGIVHPKRPHFGATGHAPPETENQTRPDRGFFFGKIWGENRPEPCK